MTISAWEKNLEVRANHKIKDCNTGKSDNFIYQSPCDLGVIRNGGKRGTKHGPAALMAPFKNLNAPHDGKFSYHTKVFNPQSTRVEDFETVQSDECQFFESELKGHSLLHLGGGHDHIFPFASALAKNHDSLIIINIDAHLDTRPDEEIHSGTPFRQLHGLLKGKLHLMQVGIHAFANDRENYKEMGSMEVLKNSLSPEDLKNEIKKWLTSARLAENIDDTPLLLSVDCDGLDGSFMPAVSAPNHRGLSQDQFRNVFEACLDYWRISKAPRALGIYEFNPLFDDLSQRSARYMASYMYEFMTMKDGK